MADDDYQDVHGDYSPDSHFLLLKRLLQSSRCPLSGHSALCTPARGACLPWATRAGARQPAKHVDIIVPNFVKIANA